MQPYYSDELTRLYLGSCMERDEWLTGDVMVTDPPYGMAHKSGWLSRPIEGDGSTEIRDGALSRWGKRPAMVFGRWSEPRPEGVVLRLIWDKGEWPGMGNLSLPWGPSDEEIYILGSGWVGKRMGTVVRTNRLGGQAAIDHPTPKPVALMESLIDRCPPGVIVDPFAGSGSTLVAAKAMSRISIGVEVSEKYCEVAARRLAQDAFDFSGSVA